MTGQTRGDGKWEYYEIGLWGTKCIHRVAFKFKDVSIQYDGGGVDDDDDDDQAFLSPFFQQGENIMSSKK